MPDDAMETTVCRTDMQQAAMDEAKAALARALDAAVAAGELTARADVPDFVVEVPADTKNGDLAANLALVSAKAFGTAPRKIAEAVAAHFVPGGPFARIEVAGPGFLNLFYAEGFFSGVVQAAVAAGADYGRTSGGAGQRVNVEFVSANPTGPMHLGNARGAALGDSLAALFAMTGAEVSREFYINDAGNQIAKFGMSLAARYLQIVKGEDAVVFPEDGYQGDDIRQRAQEYVDLHGPGLADQPQAEIEAALVAYALPLNIQKMKDDLGKYKIEYDTWFSEQSLYDSGAVMAAVDKLKERGAIYEQEGALWFKTTDYGCEKDDVLVRANGVPTYMAADIAYHADKFERGFTQLIDVWGADHHGHVARMKVALTAMGYDADRFTVVLMQFVRLMQGGEVVRMSKRTGKAITLETLLDEVPIDSARFHFNMREPGSTIEFDMDQAVAEDSNNPVYYVQYAHARICSILRNLAEEGTTLNTAGMAQNTLLLTAPEERALIRKVAAYPGEIVRAAQGMDPARITHFLTELATAFHKFYTACRIKGEAEELAQARLALAVAAKNVLQNGLALFKIDAPERM